MVVVPTTHAGILNVAAVVSNHELLRSDVEALGLPFIVIPVEKGEKAAAEERLVEEIGGAVDLVVLARYMQILSGDLIDRLDSRGDEMAALSASLFGSEGAREAMAAFLAKK